MITVLQGSTDVDCSILRNSNTARMEFRLALQRISYHLGVACAKHIPTRPVPINTPNEPTLGFSYAGSIVLLPILRAGLGLLPAFEHLYPMAATGFIGVQRDHQSLQPQQYYHNVPPIGEHTTVILLDPMLATGGSILHTLDALGNNAGTAIVACVLAAPEGMAAVRFAHPNVRIIAAAVDRELNKSGYILPGLGDAGDRLYGT
jgi:uracil phosphoribosyltransferase